MATASSNRPRWGLSWRATDSGLQGLHHDLLAELPGELAELVHQAFDVVPRNRADLHSEHALAGGDVVDARLADVQKREPGRGLPAVEAGQGEVSREQGRQHAPDFDQSIEQVARHGAGAGVALLPAGHHSEPDDPSIGDAHRAEQLVSALPGAFPDQHHLRLPAELPFEILEHVRSPEGLALTVLLVARPASG